MYLYGQIAKPISLHTPTIGNSNQYESFETEGP